MSSLSLLSLFSRDQLFNDFSRVKIQQESESMCVCVWVCGGSQELIPCRATWCCVLRQGTSPYLPRGECDCTYCKSLWIRASAKCKCITLAHTLVLTFVSTEQHLLLCPTDNCQLWSRLNNREVGILSMPRWNSRKCLHNSYNTTNCSGSYFNYCCLSVIFFVCKF